MPESLALPLCPLLPMASALVAKASYVQEQLSVTIVTTGLPSVCRHSMFVQSIICGGMNQNSESNCLDSVNKSLQAQTTLIGCQALSIPDVSVTMETKEPYNFRGRHNCRQLQVKQTAV